MIDKLFNFFEGKLTKEEREHLLDDLSHSEPAKKAYIEVKNFLAFRNTVRPKKNRSKEDEVLNNLHQRLSIPPAKEYKYGRKAAAFTFILAVCVSAIFFTIKINNHLREDEAIEYIIAQNKIQQENAEVIIELSTGEKVNLLENGQSNNLSAGKISIKSSGNQIKILPSENESLQEKSGHGVPPVEKAEPVKMNSIHIKGKNDYLLTLEDGSKVWLRSNAKFFFPDEFQGEERNVKLDGEGYFSIAKNEKKPFVIHTGKASIKVLGTEFNLISRLDEEDLELSMVTGHVAFETDHTEPLYLTANEQLKINLIHLNYTINEVDGYKYKAWTEGYFVFIDEDLATIIKTVGEWYGIKIELLSPQLNTLKFNGKFRVDRGLEHLMKTLQLSYHFNFYVNEKTIYIK